MKDKEKGRITIKDALHHPWLKIIETGQQLQLNKTNRDPETQIVGKTSKASTATSELKVNQPLKFLKILYIIIYLVAKIIYI